MMRIDGYTHFVPTRFYKEVLSVGSFADIGKRMLGVPSIYDVNIRLKVVDKFKDYAQVITYPMPPLEVMTKDPNAGRGIRPDHQRRLRRAVRQASRPLPRLGRAGADVRARTSACARPRAR